MHFFLPIRELIGMQVYIWNGARALCEARVGNYVVRLA